ncbi:MAG: DinB family protein [Terriglobales bacterium]
MPSPSAVTALDFAQETLQAYALNDRMNQLLLEHLDARAWRAKIPGNKSRTIAAIFAHVHNIRCKWLRLSALHLKLPAQLDRSRCTQKQTRAALAKSAGLCSRMLAEALTVPQGRVRSFVRDGWARPWPPGVAMFAYMISHDAHHRGQVSMLAHQLGFPLTGQAAYGIWVWERLARDCGFQLLASHKTKRPAKTGRRPTKG